MENSQLTTSHENSPHQILDILQRANLAPSTRAKYIRVVEGYLATGHPLTDQEALAVYAATLSSSRRGHLKSAVRKWTQAMTTAVKAQATPDNINAIQATLLRSEALQGAIQVSAPNGQKAHTWLSPAEVKQLLLGESYRAVINVRGKGAKDRAVPIARTGLAVAGQRRAGGFQCL